MSAALKTALLAKLDAGLHKLGAAPAAAAQLRQQLSDHLDAHLARAQAVARHDDRRAAIGQIYLAAIRKTLAQAKLQILHKLHAGTGRVKNTTPVAANFLFNLSQIKDMFRASMRQAGEEAVAVSAQGMLSEIGIDQQYVTPHGVIHDFTINRANKLSGVPDEIYDTLKRQLEKGIQAGESMDQLAQRVQDQFDDIDAGRAQTIATTETASAYGTGRMDAMQQAGFTYKSWLNADDDHVRLSHREAQAEGPIPYDQDFGNGLSYPGDPDGEPAEVINCRCVIQAADAPEGKEEGE